MESVHNIFVCVIIALVAFLYSAVGQAGTTGYIAVLTLFGFGALVIKPTALLLGILVAAIGSLQFWRAGYFSGQLFWRFALLAIPAAYLGGYIRVPPLAFRLLLGLALIIAAVRLIFRQDEPAKITLPSVPLSLGIGAIIGLVAGLTGTGGGFVLTPLLLFCGWARTRTSAAVTVVFILVNSMAGLLGYFTSGQPLPSIAILFAMAAIGGGFCGSYYGSRKLPVRALHLLLAVVLVLAGVKLLFTG